MPRQIDKVQVEQVVEDQVNRDIANGYPSLNASGDVAIGDIPTGAINADTLDNLDSTQFIRSDAADNFSGTLNYTPNTGTVIDFDTKDALIRHTTNGGISLGCDDALVLGCGESRAATVAGYGDMVTEHTHIATDFNTYIYTTLQSEIWANRNTFTFSGNTLYTPGNIQEGGTNLSSKYLGISGKAADTDLLDGITNTSFLRSNAVDTASSKITFATSLARSAHNVGHLEGSYNNVGANSTNTNPIYTIGSNYNPGTTTLGSMYGIGYTHNNATFINPAGSTGWGMYVAYNGNDPNIWLDGSYGIATCTGSMYEAGSTLGSKYLGLTATAADSAKLNGVASAATATADTIARRHTSGYIYSVYMNANNGDTGTAATRVVMGYDSFLRWQSKATFISTMGLATTTTKVADTNLLDGIDSTGFARAGTFTNNYMWVRRSTTSTTTALYVTNQSSGYIQAWYQGTTSGSHRAHISTAGSIYSPDQIASSDRRLKENIKGLSSYLDISLKIADIVRVYDRLDTDDKNEIGFVAQELEKIAPEFVTQENNDYKGVRYGKMVTPLFKTIQEQNTIIKKQQARLKILKNNVQHVEELINTLIEK